MRLMLKFSVPVETGNDAVEDGSMAKAIEKLVADTGAEAAYFSLIDGERAGYVFFEETDQAKLTTYNEPLFAALDAHIEIVPVLSLEDLKRGL